MSGKKGGNRTGGKKIEIIRRESLMVLEGENARLCVGKEEVKRGK